MRWVRGRECNIGVKNVKLSFERESCALLTVLWNSAVVVCQPGKRPHKSWAEGNDEYKKSSSSINSYAKRCLTCARWNFYATPVVKYLGYHILFSFHHGTWLLYCQERYCHFCSYFIENHFFVLFQKSTKQISNFCKSFF